LHNRAIIADFCRFVFVISVKFAGKTGKEIERGTDIIFRPAKKKGALSCGGRSLL
jgi:hypothetical protein